MKSFRNHPRLAIWDFILFFWFILRFHSSVFESSADFSSLSIPVVIVYGFCFFVYNIRFIDSFSAIFLSLLSTFYSVFKSTLEFDTLRMRRNFMLTVNAHCENSLHSSREFKCVNILGDPLFIVNRFAEPNLAVLIPLRLLIVLNDKWFPKKKKNNVLKTRKPLKTMFFSLSIDWSFIVRRWHCIVFEIIIRNYEWQVLRFFNFLQTCGLIDFKRFIRWSVINNFTFSILFWSTCPSLVVIVCYCFHRHRHPSIGSFVQ